jgi:hypothetical protein
MHSQKTGAQPLNVTVNVNIKEGLASECLSGVALAYRTAASQEMLKDTANAEALESRAAFLEEAAAIVNSSARFNAQQFAFALRLAEDLFTWTKEPRSARMARVVEFSNSCCG